MGARKPSLYPTDDRECFFCGNTMGLETHHVYGGTGRRSVSDREGCTIVLCNEHHQGRKGVHQNAGLRAWLRADCQQRWEEREGLSGEEGHDAFRSVFGSSYL